MSDKEWRPKVGERVALHGVVTQMDGTRRQMFNVVFDDVYSNWFAASELSPLPAPAAPRPAWEVLEEAAHIAAANSYNFVATQLSHLACSLKAAAAPKPPPTLAEAVRAYLDKPGFWRHVDELRFALARAEAGQ